MLDVMIRGYLQSTRTMLQLHEEDPIQIRRLERHNVVLPLFPGYLRCELQVLRADQLETLGHIGKSQRRAGEDKEFLLCRVLTDLRCFIVE